MTVQQYYSPRSMMTGLRAWTPYKGLHVVSLCKALSSDLLLSTQSPINAKLQKFFKPEPFNLYARLAIITAICLTFSSSHLSHSDIFGICISNPSSFHPCIIFSFIYHHMATEWYLWWSWVIHGTISFLSFGWGMVKPICVSEKKCYDLWLIMNDKWSC